MTSRPARLYKGQIMNRAHRILPAALTVLLVIILSGAALRSWWGEHLMSRALSEQKRGNILGAEVLYQRALKCGKEEAAVTLARMAFFGREWEDLRRYARQAVALNPLRGYVHILLGHARAAEKGFRSPAGVDAVLKESRRAVLVEPTNADLWRLYADLALRLYVGEVLTWEDGDLTGRYRGEVVRAYRQAIRFDPERTRDTLSFLVDSVPDTPLLMEITAGQEAQVLEDLVGILLGKGRWEEARDSYWDTSSRSSSLRAFRLAAAEALRRSGRSGEASAVLQEYLLSSPHDAEALFRAAEVGVGQGGKTSEETERLFRRALELEPENWAWQRRFAVFLFHGGNVSEAFSRLRQVVKAKSGDAETYYYLGRIMELQGDAEGARGHFRRAIALSPGNEVYRKALEGT